MFGSIITGLAMLQEIEFPETYCWLSLKQDSNFNGTNNWEAYTNKTKNQILSCIFSEKLIIEKGRVTTTPFSPQVQVLLNITKGFKRSKKNRRSILTYCLLWLPLLSIVAT